MAKKPSKYNFNVEGEPNKSKYNFEGTESILTPKELPGYSKEAGYNNFGKSKYDEQLTKDYFGVEQGDNTYGFERVRGERQTIANKAANGIGRALVKTGTRTLNGIISPLYGAVSALYNQDASKLWDNKITEMEADIESSLDKAMPLYKTKREEDAHGLNKLLYANTLYGDVLDGISYSASALGSGYATGKLLTLAGKLSTINKAGEFLNGLKTIEKADDLIQHVNKYEGIAKAIDGSKKGLQLYASASTEASVEGYQAANEWETNSRNKIIAEQGFITPEQEARLKELRKQVGNVAFGFNLPVIVADNLFSFGRAMLGNKVTNSIVGAAERAVIEDGVYSQAKKSLLTKITDKTYGIRKFGVPMVSEGNQEMLQYAVQKGSQDYYNKKYFNPTADDFISSMKQGLYEAYGTKEGWDQGLIGALSSGIFSNATVLKTEGVKGFKNPNSDEAVNQAVEYLNSRTGKDAYKDLYQAYVRHSNLSDEQDAALSNKDNFGYHNATSDMFLNYVASRIKTGKIDDLRTDLESFKKLTPDQLKQQGIELSDSELTGHKQSVIDYVQTRLNKVADIEKLHNNINENYPTAPEGVKERLIHAAWSLDDSNKRIKELTENAGMLARKSASTADISLINILHDYANLPKENREASKAAIANNPLASPHIQDEILTKLKDVDLLIDRRQEFIDAYKQLKDPAKQQEIAEKDSKFEAEVEEVLSKPTPTEETGETKEQAEQVLSTKEESKETNKPFELDLNDLADISAGEVPQFDAEGNEIVSTPETTTTEKTPVSEVDPKKAEIERRRQEELFNILSEEDKQIALKIPEGDKRNKWVKTRVTKTTKGNDVVERHNAEDALSTSTDIATRIAAKRKLESNQPFNSGSISDINKVIYKIKNDDILIGSEKLIKDYYDAELKALEQQSTSTTQSEIEAKKADIEEDKFNREFSQTIDQINNFFTNTLGLSIKFDGSGRRKLDNGKEVVTYEITIYQNGKAIGNTGFKIVNGKIEISLTEINEELQGKGIASVLYQDINNALQQLGYGVLHSDTTFLEDSRKQETFLIVDGKELSLDETSEFLLSLEDPLEDLEKLKEEGRVQEIKKVKPGEKLWQSLERKGLAEKLENGQYRFINDKYDAELEALEGTQEEPIARAKTSSNPREIYPGLNSSKRAQYNLPSGNEIRTIVQSYNDRGVDINDMISIRPYVTTTGTNSAIISIKDLNGNYIDLGNVNSYDKDNLTTSVITKLHNDGKSYSPKELGIYFSMTEKTIQLEDKETKQPNLNQLTTDVRVNGEYLIYDRNNGGWANPYYDDSNLEIPVDFEEVDNFNKKELNNSRFVLLVPNGNKYSYVRLRNELLSNDDINSLFNELKTKAVEFKNNKDLTVDEINAFNEAINSQLFIALNPNLKVGQTLVNGSELTFKIGKFGKFQAELRYKVGKDYKSVTEYLNITDVKDMSSLLGLVNKEFKDKHDTDLNLKPNDLQQHVDLDKPKTFRAATKPNVFNPNYGNQLVFDELNIEEQPVVNQIAKAAEVKPADNTLNEDTEEDEDDIDLDNIVYSIDDSKINYTYKAIDKILNNKSKVNGWFKQIKDKTQLWDKIQKDLAIPKEQTDLLKFVEGNNVDEIITNFLADYSYVVKVDTTIGKGDFSHEQEELRFNEDGTWEAFTYNNDSYEMSSYEPEYYGDEGLTVFNKNGRSISQEEYQNARNDKFARPDTTTKEPSQYYSNLTVPGGTNGSYKERNFETPLIKVPKSHAQFNTENTIGFTRGDDRQIYTEKDIDSLLEIMKKSGVLEVKC